MYSQSYACVIVFTCLFVIHIDITHVFYIFFFFNEKTANEMRFSDWSSDVCSSDLIERLTGADAPTEETSDVVDEIEMTAAELADIERMAKEADAPKDVVDEIEMTTEELAEIERLTKDADAPKEEAQD